MKETTKFWTIGLAAAAFSAGVICYSIRNSECIIPAFVWPNDLHPESITIYNPQDKRICYVDKKPFGSVDYVVDYTSGERVERKPTRTDCEKFSELEKIVRERGMIPSTAKP